MSRVMAVMLVRRVALSFGLIWLGLIGGLSPVRAQNANAPGGQLSQATLSQIAAIAADKATRTPAQQKMDSQLIYAERANRNQAIVQGAPNLKVDVKIQPGNLVLVDIDALVSTALLQEIVRVGGQVVSSFPSEKSIRAFLPLGAIETLAARPDVSFIKRAIEAQTNSEPAPQPRLDKRMSDRDIRKSRIVQSLSGVTTAAGSVTSQGDVAHRAAEARATFGIDGTGIKIGVLSDGVNSLVASQNSGDLPSNVTVLPGQAGNGHEGTAMLEIVHDIAPGAQLFYATGFGGVASFANNIRALRTAGCDIIVDDVTYFNESPFQAAPIEKAVFDVSNDGALFFSSAANSGNKNDGTSGTWVGDFADGGAAVAPPYAKIGRLHDFGGATFNTVTSGGSSRRVGLFWSDPLGASSNDYDVYVLNSSGGVLDASTTTQSGSQDPYESISELFVNERIVIVKTTGAADRYLYLTSGRGRLTFNTDMNVVGHNAAGAPNAFCVAASQAFNRPFATSDVVETFSSDGLRRVFYDLDGTAITPGNLGATGGRLLQKPDITAADGVVTTAPGFSQFFGTSAAAPHAAAIAGLLKSYNPRATPAQIRAALQSTALDIEALGVDRDSGAGIITVPAAINALPAPAPNLVFASSAIGGGNGNAVIDPNECNLLDIILRNSISSSGETATGINATLVSNTVGVTIAQGSFGLSRHRRFVQRHQHHAFPDQYQSGFRLRHEY